MNILKRLEELMEKGYSEEDALDVINEERKIEKEFTTMLVNTFPRCGLCDDYPAKYTGLTYYEYWTTMCPNCFKVHGKGLGLGIGQQLILADKPTAQSELNDVHLLHVKLANQPVFKNEASNPAFKNEANNPAFKNEASNTMFKNAGGCGVPGKGGCGVPGKGGGTGGGSSTTLCALCEQPIAVMTSYKVIMNPLEPTRTVLQFCDEDHADEFIELTEEFIEMNKPLKYDKRGVTETTIHAPLPPERDIYNRLYHMCARCGKVIHTSNPQTYQFVDNNTEVHFFCDRLCFDDYEKAQKYLAKCLHCHKPISKSTPYIWRSADRSKPTEYFCSADCLKKYEEGDTNED